MTPLYLDAACPLRVRSGPLWAIVECPLLTQSGHGRHRGRCPPFGGKADVPCRVVTSVNSVGMAGQRSARTEQGRVARKRGSQPAIKTPDAMAAGRVLR